MNTIIETCPHCGAENEYVNHDTDRQGCITRCSKCGEEICLCGECVLAGDNPRGFCDWHEEIIDGVKCGVCFRGITHRLNEFKSSI